MTLPVFTQNYFNTYQNYEGTSTSPFEFLHSDFDGEYQIFVSDTILKWFRDRTPTNQQGLAISYKIESASFPFVLNLEESGFFDRLHKLPPNDSYDSMSNLWIISDSHGEIEIFNEMHERSLLDPVVLCANNNTSNSNNNLEGVEDINPPSDLISFFWKEVSYEQSPNYCRVYPHTVLKHTLYVHCGNSIQNEIIDSLVITIDHTRGEMKRYPFWKRIFKVKGFPCFMMFPFGPGSHLKEAIITIQRIH